MKMINQLKPNHRKKLRDRMKISLLKIVLHQRIKMKTRWNILSKWCKNYNNHKHPSKLYNLLLSKICHIYLPFIISKNKHPKFLQWILCNRLLYRMKIMIVNYKMPFHMTKLSLTGVCLMRVILINTIKILCWTFRN